MRCNTDGRGARPNAAPTPLPSPDASLIDAPGCGCSSGVEHNLAKVRVEGSNPFARSKTRAIDDGETCREAVRREAMEEGGLELDTPPELFHVYRSAGNPGRDHVVLFVARGVRQPRPKPPSLEIVASGFHAPEALPDGVTAGSRRRLEEILGGRPPADTW